MPERTGSGKQRAGAAVMLPHCVFPQSGMEQAPTVLVVIARSEATKQSSFLFVAKMDCFAEFIIGRRFAPTRWLAMTA